MRPLVCEATCSLNAFCSQTSSIVRKASPDVHLFMIFWPFAALTWNIGIQQWTDSGCFSLSVCNPCTCCALECHLR